MDSVYTLTKEEMGLLPKKKRLAGGGFYFTGKPCINGHITFRRPKGYCNTCYWIHVKRILADRSAKEELGKIYEYMKVLNDNHSF